MGLVGLGNEIEVRRKGGVEEKKLSWNAGRGGVAGGAGANH